MRRYHRHLASSEYLFIGVVGHSEWYSCHIGRAVIRWSTATPVSKIASWFEVQVVTSSFAAVFAGRLEDAFMNHDLNVI